jgi:hypothetical protein
MESQGCSARFLPFVKNSTKLSLGELQERQLWSLSFLLCVVNFSRFKGIECKIIQRYNPAPDLLGLYVYGYLNRIGSSRRLEREVGRRCGVDVVTLVHDLRIDYRFVT